MKDTIEKAKEKVSKQLCIWSRLNGDFEDTYETSCGEAFVLNDGTPRQNKMKFCCYCGKPLEQRLK